MSPRTIINSFPDDLSGDELLGGLYPRRSGFISQLTADAPADLLPQDDLRLCCLAAGRGLLSQAGRSHPLQQHDVFFLHPGERPKLSFDQGTPAELWWIDFYGPALRPLLRKIAVSPEEPVITGVYDPGFLREIKNVVSSCDAASDSDKMHIIAGAYRLFGILLDTRSYSQWVTVPHDSPAILYTGKWTAWPSPFGSAHEEYYTGTPKSYAEYNFTGTGIKWFGTVNFDCGVADVIVDGEFVQSVDTYSPVRLTRQLLYVNTRLPLGNHIVKIFCTGRRNDKATNCDITVESFQSLPTSPAEAIKEDPDAVTQLCSKAISLMKLNVQDMTVDKLAQVLDVNRSYLSSRFTAEVGLSPTKYLTRVRIGTAKKLLSDTDLPVSQVAQAVGYADAFYFSRLFKRLEGLSPTDFRKLNRPRA